MKKNIRRKRRISLILTMLLISGILAPLLGTQSLVVRAAGEEPSIYFYASQKQLMDGTLNMSSPDAATVGYINFGKDENGNAKWWYVIGQDKGNAKLNTILFSSKSIKMEKPYFMKDADPTAQNPPTTIQVPGGVNAKGIFYKDNSDPTEVYVNNYGVSALREKFIDMQTDENYFTKAEQNLMLQTTISNTDADDNVYTVKDKLYAPMAKRGNSESYLLFGSGEDEDAMVKAFPKGVDECIAWTRTPVRYMQQKVYAWLGADSNLNEVDVFTTEGYHPAFTLDLTEVLFASAVPVSAEGTGKLKKPNAMNLRMGDDGTRFKGAVLAYSPGVITYNTERENSYLVVQGKTESGADWYYTAKATTNGVNYMLKWNDVKTKVKDVDIGTEESFDKCKIWIETTDTDSGLTYAILGKSTQEEPKEIGNVILTGIEMPDPEKKVFDQTAKCETEGIASAAPAVSWSDKDGKEVTEPEYDQTYTATVTLEAATGYKFADKVSATVNGHEAKASLNPDTGILTVTYDFKVGSNEPKIEFEVDAFSGKYDGEPHSITVTPTDPADARVYYGVADEDGKVTYSDKAPEYINAGKHMVYIRIEKDGYTPVEDYVATITISKRRLRIKVNNQRIVWNDPLPIAKDKYEVEGDLLQGDQVVKVTLTAGPAGLKAGKTGWITVYNGDVEIENRDGEDVSVNYIIEGVPGELTVVHNPDLPPTSLTVKKPKTEYKVGETLDLDDLEVTAVYEDGYSEKITDYTTNADRIDMSRAGEKKLIISYEDQEEELIITVEGEGGEDNNSSNNPNDSSGGSNGNGSGGNGSGGSGSGSGGGTASGGSGSNSGSGSGGTGASAGSSNASTGDTAPLSQWSFTTVCSEFAILCVLLFYLKKSEKKKKK